jgi:superfamily II DNA or RNA helicase
VNYSETIDVLSKKLNTKCIFDGRIGDKIREENKNLFQENKEKIIIINNSAGGTGLDLPDLDGNYPRIAIISPDDSAQKIKQITGRIWRESSKSKSIEKIFFIKGTVEEDVMKNVQQKLNNLDILNDGDLKL